MTKAKNTKRALLSSVLALLVCVTMLIGTTFAWFTDSVTSAGNTIQSGTLKVDLVDADGNSMEGEVIEFVTKDNRAQDQILWEPGCTYETEPVYVVNEGNLALKYKMGINGINGDAKLLEAIEWTATIGNVEYELSALEGKLYPETGKNISEAIVLSGHMKESAGNEYQGLTVEGISITVFATQLTSEFDSFSDQYDKMATVDDIDELNAALAADYDLITLGADITLSDTLTIPSGKTLAIDLAGYAIQQTKECTNSYSMISNSGNLTILDSVGTGRITLNDTGANSGSSWGTYTIRNDGALVVENGTIENIAPNSTGNVNNAIFSYAGSTTIKGGTFNVPYSRSVRQWKGTLTIEGGTFDGQVWVQAMSDVTTTISGGSFKPATHGNDGSSVFVTNNAYDVALSVTGGTFATRLGMTVPEKCVTGGTFGTIADNIVVDGYAAVKNADGTYTVIKGVKVANATELAAILNSSATEIDVVLADGVYNNVLTASNKTINIKGGKGAVINITDSLSTSHDHLGLTNCNVTLEGVTCTFAGYYPAYINNPKMTYVDCTLKGQFYLYGDTSFIGCTFDNDGEAAKTAMNYVYTYGNGSNINVLVDNCVFNTEGHGLIMFSDYGGAGKVTMTVKDSKFHGGAGRTAYAVANQNTAAIEIDGSCGADYTLKLEGNNTFDGGFSGLWRIKAMNNGVKTTVNGVEYTGSTSDVYLDGVHYTKDANRNVTK